MAPPYQQQAPAGRPACTAPPRTQTLTAKMMLGMLPSSAMTCSLDTASVLPTMSLMRVGRYFSTCGRWGARGSGVSREA